MHVIDPLSTLKERGLLLRPKTAMVSISVRSNNCAGGSRGWMSLYDPDVAICPRRGGFASASRGRIGSEALKHSREQRALGANCNLYAILVKVVEATRLPKSSGRVLSAQSRWW